MDTDNKGERNSIPGIRPGICLQWVINSVETGISPSHENNYGKFIKGKF
jgi:hypothetical protein